MPPSTTVLASVAMPTVVARSMAGASTRCTAPVVLPDVTVHCRQSASTAGSKVTRAMTAACTMPPGPDADHPLVVESSVAGPASAPHCGGSATQPGPSPQNATGEAGPMRSETSYPAGRAPRARVIFTGLTWASARDGSVVDGREDVPKWPHAARTHSTARAAMSPNRRTPVDTTANALNLLATLCVSKAIN